MAWRSNGTLESRIANPSSGHATTRKETFTYDPLNRLDLAETYINGSNTRDLDFSYDLLGNVKSKTSTLGTDTDVTGYAYGAGNAGPHAVTSFSVDGVSRTLTYNGNGAVTRYDIAGTSDDRWIEYNAINQPTKIVVGTGLSDPSPVASDEFAYDPDGARYYRRTTWQDGGTRTEDVVTIGPVEIITDNIADEITRITKTRIGSSLMHVKVEGIETLPYYPWFQPRTEEFIEYAHRDHLGSIDVVTDENGNVLDDLEFEPFGGRKESDWAGQISASGLSSLLERDWDRSPKIRGFTSHEHLDRTGLIHMNGRVFDPEIGRFLSPDIFVANRADSQAWNRYSYVRNSPMSATDPSGFIEQGVGATGGPDGDGLVVPPLPPWWVRVGLEQMMWGNSLQPPVETGYIVEEHDLVVTPNVEVDYNSGGVGSFALGLLEGTVGTFAEGVGYAPFGLAVSLLTDFEFSTEGIFGKATTNQQQFGRDLGPIVPVTGAAGILRSGVNRLLGRLAGKLRNRAVPNKPPNPHGSRGGPEHRGTIDRRIDELKADGHTHLGGGNLKEELIRTPGGCKTCRRPDITTRAPDGSIYRENVGRSTQSGNPIARERRALDDIEAATGTRPGYTPYDR